MYLLMLHQLKYAHINKSSGILRENQCRSFMLVHFNGSTHRQRAGWVLSAHKLDFDCDVSC